MKFPFFSKADKPTVTPEVKSYSELLSPMFGFTRTASGSLLAYPMLSNQEIVQNFERIHPVYTAVTRIANAVADLPIQLINKKTQEADDEHEAFNLLQSPNRETEKTKFEIIKSFLVNYILLGNAYVITTGRQSSTPLELYSGNPLHTTYETNPSNGRLQKITFHTTSNGNTVVFNKAPDGFFYTDTKMQQLYAIHNFNSSFSPTEPVGKSEIASLTNQISLYASATIHNQSILNNGARPSGIFIAKAPNGAPAIMSDAQYQRLQQQVTESYAGANNAGRPLLLEGGLEWQSIEMSPRDLDFDNMIERAEDAIYNTLAIPTQLVKPVKTTANNMTNIRKEFYENRVLPLGDLFCSHLNNALLPRYPQGSKTAKEKYFFRINRDEIDVLIEERIKKRESVERSLVLELNEKRTILYNKPPLKHGNKVTDPNGRPIAGEDAEVIVGTATEAANAAAKASKANDSSSVDTSTPPENNDVTL